MSSFLKIQEKLQQFTRKFYVNELIKGSILFLSLGLLYFFFTLFVEYFLWLKPAARTALFWLFVVIEIGLLVRFVFFPIFKLVGLQKGISLEESSKIIGNHFPEVNDKLLNALQLKNNSQQSDLLLASIEQKSSELQPIPFTKAVNFKKNTKYVKYALIPLLIWALSFLTGTNGALTKSFERVVNHRTAYVPPAPFSLELRGENLQVIQGKPLTVYIEAVGEVVPEEVKIHFEKQQYYLQNEGNGLFSYTFSEVLNPIKFYAEANGIKSLNHTVEVIKTPTIQQMKMVLQYPYYIKKRTETIANTGNITVPEGTKINWQIVSNQTNNIDFISNENRFPFQKITDDNFEFSKRIRQNTNYQIATSNNDLKDYEKLQYNVAIIKDESPTITVKSNIDSVSRGVAQFAGQISDDYGFKKLQLVYYNIENPQTQQTFDLSITKENIQTFFYQFPDGLTLQNGVDYELFFQVFDNDAVNGAKKATSKKFSYRKKTEEEIDQELLDEQKSTIDDLQKNINQQKKQQENLKKIQQDLQNKKAPNWNDQKKIQNFIKRQKQYQNMMQRQTEKLQENFEEKQEENQSLEEKKEQLQERIKELKRQEKQQKLLEELQKMSEKLNKEDLIKKAKELAQQNKQKERSLERTLEMVKRFYVEQKTMQIANKLEELAKKQDKLQQENNADAKKELEKQQEINKDFKKIEEELKEVQKENEQLKEPMELPDVESEKNQAKNELNKSEENLQKQQQKEAKKNQKKASKKMKQMSQKMQQAMMDMQGESIDENIDDLRKILENLVTFSFQQERLMNKFETSSTKHPDFGKNLKKQNEIKTYFEHIDDSLFVLSMRLPKISSKIQDELATAHYNLDQSLENFTENRFSNGISNQRYVMTAANALADYLSSMLDNMQNSMSSMGSGKGSGNSFSLPDIIQKQQGLSEKMQKGMQQGKKGKQGEKGKEEGKDGEKGKQKGGKQGEDGQKQNGQGEGNNEDMNGELYQIYKEQSQLREQLQNLIKQNPNGKGAQQAKKVAKEMEQLENQILEKGFTQATLNRMQRLNYEMLKLKNAELKQGEDKQRKATTNLQEYQKNKAKQLQFKKLFYNQTEILNRQSLPLRQNYKKKVQEYFSVPTRKSNDKL